MSVAIEMTMSHHATQTATQILRMLIAVFAIGCTNHRQPSPPTTPDWMTPHVPWLGAQSRPAAPVRFKDPVEARYHMRMHFGDLRIVEQALIDGKLTEGLSVAFLLTRPIDDPGLASWAAQSRRVNAAALDLMTAQDVDGALRGLARVAVECAGCHMDANSAPAFPVPPAPPPDRATREARMARHAWAADRLWEAIVGNDDARWESGLTVLAAAPLPPSVLPAVLIDGGNAAAKLQAYARNQLDVRGTVTIHDRARAYGEMLVLCSRCHATRDRGR